MAKSTSLKHLIIPVSKRKETFILKTISDSVMIIRKDLMKWLCLLWSSLDFTYLLTYLLTYSMVQNVF